MPTSTQLVTPRLILRPWQPSDRAPFAAINADPAVMRFFHAPMTEVESNAAAERYNAQLDRDGFTMWAAEERRSDGGNGQLLGVIGAQTMRFAVPHLPQPAIEIGWRLVANAHGRGLATEGAHATLEHLREFGIRGVVAITTPGNLPSLRVMQKLGMTPRPELAFDHPLVPSGSTFRPHVLYSLTL